MKFSDLDINKHIKNSLSKLNFIEGTEIQNKAIPFLLESNNDLIGLAQTGTGKQQHLEFQ